MTRCVRCEDKLPNYGDFVTCNGCKGKYHYECTTVAEGTYKNMSMANKKAWRCVKCKQNKQEQDAEQDAAEREPELEKNSILKAINAKLDGISIELTDLRKSVEFMNEKYEVMLKEIKELKAFKEEHSHVNEKIKMMENKLNEIEQRDKINNLEIKGIEEMKDENLKTTCVTMATKLGVDMSGDDIETIYRVNNKAKKEPRDIIVKLKSQILKENIMQKKKSKVNSKDITKGKLDKTIYINEHLTPYNKMLLWEAKSQATEKGYKFVWVKNGLIFARKNETARICRIQHKDDIKWIV